MNLTRDPYHTTAFGMAIDHEIADALRAGMPLDLIYAELATRAGEVAQQMVNQNQAGMMGRAVGDLAFIP
jgi:hypothetical protein